MINTFHIISQVWLCRVLCSVPTSIVSPINKVCAVSPPHMFFQIRKVSSVPVYLFLRSRTFRQSSSVPLTHSSLTSILSNGSLSLCAVFPSTYLCVNSNSILAQLVSPPSLFMVYISFPVNSIYRHNSVNGKEMHFTS